MVNQPSSVDPVAFASMSDQELADEIIALISEIVPHEIREWTLDSSLSEDLGMDSLASYEFLMSAEDRFGIRISDEQLVGLKTLSDVVSLVGVNRCDGDPAS
jgi:acyl carrier protein